MGFEFLSARLVSRNTYLCTHQKSGFSLFTNAVLGGIYLPWACYLARIASFFKNEKKDNSQGSCITTVNFYSGNCTRVLYL